MTKQVDKRKYGIDLLRILSMWGIVLLHVVDRGGLIGNLAPNQASYYIITFIEAFVGGSVNCYALISGDVGRLSQWKLRSYVYLWLKVVFYCALATVLYSIISVRHFSVSMLVKAFFPVTFNSYWYFTAYTLLFFVIPILNFLIEQLSFRRMMYLLAALFFLLSVYPTISYRDEFYTIKGYSPIWLFFLYLLGGTIHKYDAATWIRRLKKNGLIVYIICSFITGAFIVICGLITSEAYGEPRGKLFLFQYISPTVLIAAFGLFAWLSGRKINPKLIPLIKYVAPCTFGVYLIHASPIVWDNLLKDAFKFAVPLSPISVFFIVILATTWIFIACVLIDKAINALFRLCRINSFCTTIEQKAYSIGNKLLDGLTVRKE